MVENELLQNIDKIHTTVLGAERVRRNIDLSNCDVIDWCKQQILCAEKIELIGKNWYVTIGDLIITINAHSYTIITAH